MSSLKSKIVKNLFWSVIGKMVQMMGGLVIGIMVARHLGPHDYGVMNYVISFVFLFQTLSIFGLDNIEIREEAKNETPREVIIGTAFTIKLCLAVLCVILCIGTSFLMDASRETTLYVAIYSLSIIAQTFNVIRNHFMAIVQNRNVVLSEINRTLIGMVIKGIMLWYGLPLIWFMAASTFDWVLLSSGYIVSYRSAIGRLREWRFDATYARKLLRESYPLLLTSAAVIMYQKIDQVMIGQLIGNKEQVGYFATASRFVEVLIYVPIMLAQTMSPVLVKIRHEQGEAIYRQRAQQFMNISIWTCMTMAVATSICAYWIIRYTFGQDYLLAVPVLQVLAFKAASVALSNTAGNMIIIEGLQRHVFIRDIMGCIVCITLNWYLLPRYDIIASALVAIISNVTAGYIADALIPSYHHLFARQTKALLIGWKDLIHIHQLVRRS